MKYGLALGLAVIAGCGIAGEDLLSGGGGGSAGAGASTGKGGASAVGGSTASSASEGAGASNPSTSSSGGSSAGGNSGSGGDAQGAGGTTGSATGGSSGNGTGGSGNCGAIGDPCCSDTCSDGATCTSEGCARCGKPGEFCCDSGNECEASACATLHGAGRCYVQKYNVAGGNCSKNFICPLGTVCLHDGANQDYCISCGNFGEPCCGILCSQPWSCHQDSSCH